METRGTGLTPQRLPSPWERKPLELGKEPDQGPMVTSKPTSRSLAPIPGEVNTQLAMGGNFVQEQLNARPGTRGGIHTPPTPEGDKGGFGVDDLDHVTGKPTKGSTKPRGAF